jgi:glutamate synthase domain-containing protein 3
MTGGTVVVLGRTGRNFAAGMSGGVAFVLDEFGEFEKQCNSAMVDISRVTARGDLELLRRLVEQHARYTGSARAKRELGRWQTSQRHFLVVVPREYRQALERSAGAAAAAISGAGIEAARHA